MSIRAMFNPVVKNVAEASRPVVVTVYPTPNAPAAYTVAVGRDTLDPSVVLPFASRADAAEFAVDFQELMARFCTLPCRVVELPTQPRPTKENTRD